MTLALSAFGIISATELMLWLAPVWRWRKQISYLLVVGLAAASGILMAVHASSWTILLCALSLYRIVNLLRIIEGRVHPDYLFHASRKTALWLIGLQAAVLGFAVLSTHLGLDALTWWYLLAVGQILAAAVLLASTIRHLRTTCPPELSLTIADRDLPSLTVAIPARNETEDLEACLRSLVASTYRKLEILVLDDCSQDRHTPEIIRSFAHDGVRFIAGSTPPEQWLAKNYAYCQLAGEANGELLLFCGVDVRFEPESLNVLVRTMLQKQKTMVSVLPRNILSGHGGIAALLTQPNRYAWELALPRRMLKRPPVLSTCWIITRAALEAAGGFEAVSRKGVPESYLARAVAASHDGYSFLQSSRQMAVSCRKNPVEQQATAIRTRYLQLHRRPELIALVSMAEFTVLVWPLIILGAALVGHAWLLAGMSGFCLLLTSTLHSKIINLTFRRFIIQGLWLLPVAAMYDIGLLHYSMWQYEFDEVIWKGRNICVPVMRVIPQSNFTADLERK